MSTTVTAGGLTLSSSSESAEALTSLLSSSEESKPEPRVLVDKGVPVELSKAASELGKEGGKASAAARKEREKETTAEADPAPVEEDEAAAEGRKLQEELDAEPDIVKRKERAKERVTEATRKARAAEQRANQLAAELERLRTAPQVRQDAPAEPQAPRQAATETDDDPRPQSGDFEHHDDYVESVSRWAARQEHKVAAQAEARERFAHEYATRELQNIDTFRSKVRAACDADPSLKENVIPFREVLQNSSRLLPPGQRPTAFNWVNDEIMESDVPGPLMRHLRGNPDVVRSLLSLTSRESIARKMGSIQASLEGATTGTPPARRAVSKAPPPIPPVTGSPHTADSEPGPDASYEAHKAYWLAKDKARAAQR